MYIYKITNKLSSKCYIGQSVNPTKRWESHKNNPCSEIGKAIQEYGENNFTFEILFECNQCDANLLESYMMYKYDSLRNGYNARYSVSVNDDLFKDAEVLYKKILVDDYILTGIYVPNGNADDRQIYCMTTGEYFDNAYLCAKYYGIVSSSRVRDVCRGKRATANDLVFRFIDDYGNIVEPEFTVKVKKTAVYVEEIGVVYSSVKEACDELNLDYRKCNSAICKCLKGDRVSAYGYHWCYYKDGDMVETGRKNKHFTRVIMDMDEDFIFESLRDACDFLGEADHSVISQCLSGKAGTAYGHTWNKVDDDGTIIPNPFNYSDIDRSKVERFEIICDNGKTYRSLAKATKDLGLNSSCARKIAKVCKGELDEAFGHKWRYGNRI